MERKMANGLPLLSRRIKQLREAAGLSQQSLAVAAGLSMSVVSQLEQGAKIDPRVSTVSAIAKALGVSIDDLWAGSGDDAGAPPSKKPGRPAKATSSTGGFPAGTMGAERDANGTAAAPPTPSASAAAAAGGIGPGALAAAEEEEGKPAARGDKKPAGKKAKRKGK
jgi:transcriptional regulator with XRE-family HTH domain